MNQGEMKFRGIDINPLFDWVYGCLNYNLDPTKEENVIREAFIRIPTGFLSQTFQVYPETIGQFTGLHDKNGTEIYENDIIEIKHPHKGITFTGVVEFNNYKFGVKDFCFTHFDNPNDIFSEGTEYIEVIGNNYYNVE